MNLNVFNERQTEFNAVKTYFFNNWNTFVPFLALFGFKIFIDHLHDILRFLLLFLAFFQANFHIQKIGSRGFSDKKMVQIVYFVGLAVLTTIAFQIDSFEFSNIFGLNIPHFLFEEVGDLSMLSTLYAVVVIDTYAKLITVIPKWILAMLPNAMISSPLRRKLLQLMEYCSELYRSLLSFGPWLRYLLYVDPISSTVANFLSFAYFVMKVAEVCRYAMVVKKSIWCLWKGSTIRNFAKGNEICEDPCVICHKLLHEPIKLECSHWFCKDCLERWVDQNTTCPMCRGTVEKNLDNEYKTGDTSLFPRMF